MSEQVAIIRKPNVGARDVGRPALWFDVYISDGGSALIVLEWSEAAKVLAQVYDLSQLDGHACWVDAAGPSSPVKFLRLWRTP